MVDMDEALRNHILHACMDVRARICIPNESPTATPSPMHTDLALGWSFRSLHASLNTLLLIMMCKAHQFMIIARGSCTMVLVVGLRNNSAQEGFLHLTPTYLHRHHPVGAVGTEHSHPLLRLDARRCQPRGDILDLVCNLLVGQELEIPDCAIGPLDARSKTCVGECVTQW